MSEPPQVADAEAEHKRLEERIRQLEAELEQQRRSERSTKRQVDQQEKRRRDALKALEQVRG